VFAVPRIPPAVAFRLAAIALGIVTGALLTWRAYSQSITYDEAFTWLEFVSRGPGEFFNNYTANNHVLFSILAMFTTRTLGTSELTLRLPSVAAGVVYAVLVLRLSRHVCSRRPFPLLTAAALILNPFILDFFVAARGYGLATTCLIAALLMSIAVPSHTSRTIAATGGLLGLSVAAHLAYSFPAAGVGVSTVLLASLGSGLKIRTVVRASATLGVALALTALPVLVVPLLHRPPRDAFRFGAHTFLEASHSLVAASLQYDTQDRWSAPAWLVTVLSAYVVPLLVVTCAVAGWTCVSRRRGSLRLDAPSVPVFVIGTTMAVTVAALAAARVTAQLPLPLERTGLYWLTLIPLGIASLTRVLERRSGPIAQFGLPVLAAVLALLTSSYAAQFSTTHFRTWRYDAGSRDIFAMIDQWPCPTTHQRVVAGTPFRFAPALEFYRSTRHAEHIRGLDILDEPYAPGEPDFYVLATAPEVEALRSRATVLFTHPVSGVTLLADPGVAACTGTRRRR
jgi:hypothetical protein